MNRNILDRLAAAGPVLGDGGDIVELERRGYGTAGGFTPHFVPGACAAEINLLRKRRIGPYSCDFSANRTTMHLKIVKIWPRFSTFSLRSFLPRRLLDHPEAIRQLHVDFLNAGAEVLQVMAFYGSRAKLATVGRDHQTIEINRKATRRVHG